MSIILCTQHKGGAGKTTLAVHLASILVTRLKRVLVIDCDTQRNSWYYYFQSQASTPLQRKDASKRLSVLWNPEKSPIRRVVDIENYDHIILDMGTPMPETVKVIVDNDPDIIFVPVSPNPYAIVGLSDVLPAISKLEAFAGFTSKVVIVPLGSNRRKIEDKLSQISQLPSRYRLAKRMRYLAKEFDQALEDGNLIWNYSGLENLNDYFSSLLD